MPHCIIEITENLLSEVDTDKLINNASNAIHSLNCFNADDIKVRIIPVKYSFLGIKKQVHAFAAAEIMIFDNKSQEQLNELSDKVQKVLTDNIHFQKGKLSLTTRISYLNEYYKRYKNF